MVAAGSPLSVFDSDPQSLGQRAVTSAFWDSPCKDPSLIPHEGVSSQLRTGQKVLIQVIRAQCCRHLIIMFRLELCFLRILGSMGMFSS